MGQAKTRGTFEQRRQQAIERNENNEKRTEELRILKLQRFESMTDEEKNAILKHERYERNLITVLFGMAGLIGSCGAGLHDPDFFGPPKLKRHHMKGCE